jgi:hypothetical protein
MLLKPLVEKMPVDYARELVALRIPDAAWARIDELAGKCNEGRLTDHEAGEFEAVAQAVALIGFMQQRARRLLADIEERDETRDHG